MEEAQKRLPVEPIGSEPGREDRQRAGNQGMQTKAGSLNTSFLFQLPSGVKEIL